MPPSPVHKTNYASEALSLLTSRYSKARPDAAPPSPFLPTSVAGCVLWLRADLGVTLSSGVSAWADQSAAGHSVSESTNKPTFNASGALGNSQPSISFTGNTQLKSATWGVALPQPLTLFIVAKQITSGTKYLFDNLSDPTQCFVFGQAPTTLLDCGNPTDTNNTYDTTQPSIFIVTFNGASSNIRLTANTPQANQNMGAAGLTGTTIGNYAGGGSFAGWEIAEVALFSNVVSSTDAASLNSYAHTRYGIMIGA